MGKSPEELRQEIERTRQDLSQDVDALSEKVSPGRVVGRKVERARGAVTSVKERVMGSAAGGVSTVSDQAGSLGDTVGSTVGDAVTGAPQAVKERTAGNPLAAGVIAFGIGWLVSSLLPATQTEERVASKAQEAAQPVVEKAGEIAKEAAADLKDNLQQPAQEAVQQVKQSATEAATTVKDEGAAATSSVAADAKDSADSVRQASQT